MKTLQISFLASFILFASTSCIYSQNDENQVIPRLKDFYTSYNIIWAKKSSPNILIADLDSLYQIYCTVSLRTELNKLLQVQGLDHDIFTNDYGTDDESIKTMTIIKDSKKVNNYIVTFFANTEDPTNKKVRVKVIIYLLVKKENGKYKIDEVK